MANKEQNIQETTQNEQKLIVRLSAVADSSHYAKSMSFGTDVPIKNARGEENNLLSVSTFDAISVLIAANDEDAAAFPSDALARDKKRFAALKLQGSKVEVKQWIVPKGTPSPLTISTKDDGVIAEKGEILEEDLICTRITKLLQPGITSVRVQKQLDKLFEDADRHIEEEIKKQEAEED